MEFLLHKYYIIYIKLILLIKIEVVTIPKIYYCEHCHQFSHREGFRFEIIKINRDKCIICKNKLKVFNVEHTNWTKIGIPFSIVFGLIIGIIIFYLLYIGHTKPENTIDYLWYFLFVSFATIIIIIAIAGGLSLFEPDAAAKKILQDHTKLVEKKLKAKYKKLPNHCLKCNKELPKKVKKCPFCGQDQY